MNKPSPDRMAGTKLDTRANWFSRILRRLSGDWWQLETKDGLWGVWHPWRPHVWENYRFTREDAEREKDRLNSGYRFEICDSCGTTFAAHNPGLFGGIECP